MMNDSPITGDILVAEYRAYRDAFDRAPNPWSTPNAREEAGYCLQYPAALQICDNLAGGSDPFRIGPWRSHVRALILTVLKQGKGLDTRKDGG